MNQELLSFFRSSSKAPTSPFKTVTSVLSFIISTSFCLHWSEAYFYISFIFLLTDSISSESFFIFSFDIVESGASPPALRELIFTCNYPIFYSSLVIYFEFFYTFSFNSFYFSRFPCRDWVYLSFIYFLNYSRASLF